MLDTRFTILFYGGRDENDEKIDDVVLCYVFWDSCYRSHFLRQLLIQQKRLYGLDGMKILTMLQ